jgi:hypothetical protein
LFLRLYAHQSGASQGGRKRWLNAAPSFKTLVDFVTALPATIPHSIVGVSFILAFSVAPFGDPAAAGAARFWCC